MNHFILLKVLITFISIKVINGMFLLAKMKYPFKRLSNTVVIQQMNLKCDEHYNSIKVCAEQSYHGNRLNNSNVGFLMDTKTKFCKICKLLHLPKSHTSGNTEPGDNEVLYLLRQNKRNPDVYLPLEPEQFAWPNITTPEVNGTLQGNIRQVDGKLNRGLFANRSGRILLQGSNRSCFSYLPACSEGLTLTMWIKPSDDVNFQYLTNADHSITMFLRLGRLRVGVYDESMVTQKSPLLISQHLIFKNTWFHIGVIYNRNVGLSLYVDGILRNFGRISGFTTSPFDSSDFRCSLGNLKDAKAGFIGVVDEIKFFYTGLNQAGQEVLSVIILSAKLACIIKYNLT